MQRSLLISFRLILGGFVFLMLWGVAKGETHPAILVIKDRDVTAETKVFEVLKETFPMTIKSIGWKAIGAEDLAQYNAMVLGSRLSEKTLIGVNAYVPKIIEAIRQKGMGFLSLNNYLFFKEGKIPTKWTKARLRSIIPRHSDDPRISVYKQLYQQFDRALSRAPFNFDTPAKTEFSDFVGTHYRAIPPRAIDRGGIELGTTLKPLIPSWVQTSKFPAFGYISNVDTHHWQIVMDAEFRGSPQPVVIARQWEKGRILLTTLFLDHEITNFQSVDAQAMYIELLKWLTSNTEQ